MATDAPLSPEGTTPDIDERYVVPGLSRGLALLQLFSRPKPEQRLAEIAEGMGLSRSAAYRLVYTLEKDGFLRRDDNTRRYGLTAKSLALGFEFLYSQPLTEISRPFLRELSDRARATAYLVMMDGWEAVHLAKAPPPAALMTNLQIGSRFPAHRTVSGRMMLAHMSDEELAAFHRRLRTECRSLPLPESFEALRATASEDRQRGFVFTRSVFEPALTGCGAAIRDARGGAVAAISVVAPHAQFDDDGGERLVAIVIEVARRFSAQLGFTG